MACPTTDGSFLDVYMFAQFLGDAPFNGIEPYFVAITTRAPLAELDPNTRKWVPFENSFTRRGVLMAETAWIGNSPTGRTEDGAPILLATAHLESYLGPELNQQVLAERVHQLKEVRSSTPSQSCRLSLPTSAYSTSHTLSPLPVPSSIREWVY